MASLAVLWPAQPGVLLTPDELADVVMQLALQALVGGAFLGLVLARSQAAVAVAASLPPLLLVALAHAPRTGSISVRVDDAVIYAIGAVGAAAALLAMGRHARIAAGACWTLLLAGAAAGLAGGSGPATGPAAPDAPDILFLTLDTVRADHLDFLSGDVDKAHTPHLSALAARGRVYDQAFAPMAITGPSHATMFSGVSPREHGVRRNGTDLPAELPWVPELLADAGYRNRAVVSAAVLEGSLGFWRGFHAYDSQFLGQSKRAIEEGQAVRLVRGHGLLSWKGWRRRAGSAHHRLGDQTLEVVAGLPEEPDTPTLTWIHLYDAHWPYTPTEEAARRAGLPDARPLKPGLLPVFLEAQEVSHEDLDRGQRLYRAGLEDLDALVGQILEGVGEDTVVVVVADHGESLGEHDYTFNHGKLPYAPDTRVPLIIAGPGIDAGVVSSPVAVADLAPTLLELAKVEVPETVGGVSLLSPDPQRRVVSASWAKEFPSAVSEGEELGSWAGVAVRSERLSAAVTRWEPASTYERTQDPRELSPLLLEEGTPAPASWVALHESMRTELGRPVTGGAEVREEMMEALEALGYVDPVAIDPETSK